MPDARVGDRFGPFELVRRIGGGGNADVFEATNGQRSVAVKVLRNRRVDSEPYARFRREIKVLRTLGDWPGVLPLIDADLPDSLATGQRAWLAMPIARRIDEALRDAELSVIVAAIGSIAHALADLQQTSRLAHRDLKPENLYEHDGRFVVGDFGLVSLPDAERLTAPGRVVGPVNFVAYEMMESPMTADPAAADVYSLAKTLWVLATGSRWPPPGHQPVGQSPSIGAYRPHPRASELDALVDRATRLTPGDRPSMAAFAGDVRVWLELPPSPVGLDELAAVGAELRRRAAPHIEASDAAARESGAVYRLYERLDAALEPVTSTIQAAFPNVGSPNAGHLVQLLQSYPAFGEPVVRIRYAAGSTVREYAEISANTLQYGALVEHLEGGLVRVGVAITLGRDGEHADDVWVEDRGVAPVESLAAERLVDAAAAELVRKVPDALRRFLARIE